MKETYLISDLHLGHEGITQFSDHLGKPLRPWDNATEMNEALIENWNSVVRPQDKIYILGDWSMSDKHIKIAADLNGDKVLIRGNHDLGKMKEYAKYFRDIRGCHVLDGMILTHVPIHPTQMRRFGTNVHGHLHSNRVMLPESIDTETGEIIYGDRIDPRYFSVCAEQIFFTPIHFDDMCAKIVAQGGMVGFKPQGNGPTQAD